MHKRILSILLVLLMIIGIVPASAIQVNAATISLNRPLDKAYTITAREYYSDGDYHGAIDYGCPKGTPVYAAESGVVTVYDGGHGDGYYGSQAGNGWGNYVDISHSNGYTTRYAHMSAGKFVVKTGDSVKKGQLIGYSGNSGSSTGPHLHFGLYLNWVKVYPEQYIKTATGYFKETHTHNIVDIYCTICGDSISAPTRAQISSDKASYTVGDTITFTLNTNGTVNSLWLYKPDGSSISYSDIKTSTYSLTITEPGKYQALVQAWNGTGSKISEKITFNVFDHNINNKYPVPIKCYPLSSANHAADAYDSVNGNHIGYIYGDDYCTIKEIYDNGWCLVNCPWYSSTKDVYTWTAFFLNMKCDPYLERIEAGAKTYIRLNSSTELGYVNTGEQVTIVDNTSAQAQIIYSYSDGTYRCAWVNYHPTFTHVHTPGPAATCTEPQVCVSCDATIVNELGHNPGTAASCSSPQVCTRCNVILADMIPHNIVDIYCTICGDSISAPTRAQISSDKASYTVGDTITFTLNTNGTVNSLWLYKPDGSSISYSDIKTSTYSLTITEPGKYQALVQAWNGTGSKTSELIYFTVGTEPKISGITYLPANPRVRDNVKITISAEDAEMYKLFVGQGENVLFESEAVDKNEFSHIFSSVGTYWVYVYAYNGEYYKQSDKIEIIVGAKEVDVAGISLNKTNLLLNAGDSESLIATVTPVDAVNKNVIWSSSDDSVVTVRNGLVTAVKTGSATITAATADGSKCATCFVTVKDVASSCTYSIVPNKVSAMRGEIIDFTVYMQQTGKQNTIQGVLSIPEGLTFVDGSGKVTTGIIATLNWDALDWTPSSMLLNGYGSESFTGTDKIALMTFKCRVDEDAKYKSYTVNMYDLLADNESYDTKNPICIPAVIAVEENVTVSGTVDSFGNETDKVTVGLYKSGATTASYSTAVTGNSTSYSISNVAPGTYTMKVSKTNHVTREYTIIVNASNVTQNVKIHLKGDINGDGKVNTSDVGRANAHAKKTNLLEDYAFACADVNGDGKVNTSDVGRMNAHAKKTNPMW